MYIYFTSLSLYVYICIGICARARNFLKHSFNTSIHVEKSEEEVPLSMFYAHFFISMSQHLLDEIESDLIYDTIVKERLLIPFSNV